MKECQTSMVIGYYLKLNMAYWTQYTKPVIAKLVHEAIQHSWSGLCINTVLTIPLAIILG
jgi:hypothetical protein